MKKIFSIIVLVLALCLTSCEFPKTQKEKYIDKCFEEFTFDYEEKVVAFNTKAAYGTDEKGKSITYLIVEVYGEKTYAVYICNNGEVWNYMNQSS